MDSLAFSLAYKTLIPLLEKAYLLEWKIVM